MWQKMKLENLRNKYFNYFNKKIASRQNFLSDMMYFNKLEKTKVELKYNFEKNLIDDYLYYVLNATYLEFEAQKKGLTPLFLTLTLPSKYHKYKTIKVRKDYVKLIKNKNFDENFENENVDHIRLGYKILSKFFRSLVKNFEIKEKVFDEIEEKEIYVRKSIDLKYIKVVEPHSSFTLHLHSLIYIDPEHVVRFKTYFYKKVKKWQKDGKIGDQVKLEILKKEDRGASYLLKYLQKYFKITKSNEKKKEFELRNAKILYGWKLKHKIRIFTSSRIVPISRENFKKMTHHLKWHTYKNLLEEGDPKNYMYLVASLVGIRTYTYNQKELLEAAEKIDDEEILKEMFDKKGYLKREFNLTGDILPQFRILIRRKYDYYFSEKLKKVLVELKVKVRFLKVDIENKKYEKLKMKYDDYINFLHLYDLYEEFQFFAYEKLYMFEYDLFEKDFKEFFSYLLEFLQNMFYKKRKKSYKIETYQIFKLSEKKTHYELVYDKNDFVFTLKTDVVWFDEDE